MDNYQADIETIDSEMNKLKDYYIYIKSHTDAPDYEDTCEATNKGQASEIFADRINKGEDSWSPGDLMEYIEEEK